MATILQNSYVCTARSKNEEAGEDPYLYYVETLLDREDNYGTENGQSVSGTWSWNDIEGLLHEDGETTEYFHALLIVKMMVEVYL